MSRVLCKGVGGGKKEENFHDDLNVTANTNCCKDKKKPKMSE